MLRCFATILTFLALNATISYGQNRQYDSIATHANALFEANHFLNAALEYNHAFQTLGGKGIPKDRYYAAMAWTLSGKSDSAFFNLFRLADKTDFLEAHTLESENNFAALQHDKRWHQLLEKINPNQEIYHDSLASVLSKIYDDDQKYRKMMDDVRYRNGRDSKEYKELLSTMIMQDSINLDCVSRTIDLYGWLSVNEVGRAGNSALWLVIQHAELAVQEKYFPVMQEAVKNRKTSKQNLAYLEDRILMRQGKKQLYGTQYKLDLQTNEMKLWEIEDPENLNKRRESVGLPAM